MSLGFKLLPFSNGSPVKREILFSYALNSHTLTVNYKVSDALGIDWPKKLVTARTYNLWQSTCFELFIKEKNSNQYYEFNFSPSSEWDAYAFQSYRSPSPPQRLENCQVEFLKVKPDELEIDVHLPFACAHFMANATAVIKEENSIEYYALVHAKEKPDFHRQETLLLELK